MSKEILDSIPATFKDDGCSNAPDKVFRFDLSWACRIHDWRYCTRSHPAGTLNQSWRSMADKELKRNIKSVLPWRWRWIRYAYHVAVWRYGGFAAFDSCGRSAGKKCRHNMSKPAWMTL